MSRLFTRKVRSWTVSARAPQSRIAQRSRRGIRLRLLDLEDRTTPTNFHVTDPGDAGAGTLRQAIQDANSNTGADIIDFDQTVFGTPRTIALTSTLAITDDLTITGPGTN